jgi:hypothetical protein
MTWLPLIFDAVLIAIVFLVFGALIRSDERRWRRAERERRLAAVERRIDLLEQRDRQPRYNSSGRPV